MEPVVSIAKSRWIKCISTQGTIRGVAIQATDLVNELAAVHGLKGVYARGLGEALMGALLIASYCKTGERINLNIQGSGRFQQALVDAHPDGVVRGYVTPHEGASISSQGDEMGPWGSGLLSVLRTRDEEGKQPYIGTVPLLTGHLAKDLTFYWAQSEQIPSAVGLAVHLEGDEVKAAGGFLVQALPGASSSEVQAVEKHINEIDSLAERLAENADPVNLLSQIFQSTAFMIIEEKPVLSRCTCSWERVQRALLLVGTVELQSMLKDEIATVRCDFCTKEYKVDPAMLSRLIHSGQDSDGSGAS
jgi:molecular chaperone Hsp33